MEAALDERAQNPSATVAYYTEGIQRIPLAFEALDAPMIAAVNGPAIGAGTDLACMCDLRIAAEEACFAESFVKLGIIPGDGGAWFLPRIVGWSKACEMAFTGDLLSARDALACGLVSQVVPKDELIPASRRLAERIAANPPLAVRATKRLLREGRFARLDTLLQLAAGAQAIAHTTGEHREALTAALAKPTKR
jgi:enoyl-CoA hydratase/carnithine racemase